MSSLALVVKLFYFLCNLPMLLNAYIENYAELFTNVDAKMANIILEMIFVENRINNKDIGLNLNFYGWQYFVERYSEKDKENCLKYFNVVPYSTKLQYYHVSPGKLSTFRKDYKIWCRCFNRL